MYLLLATMETFLFRLSATSSQKGNGIRGLKMLKCVQIGSCVTSKYFTLFCALHGGTNVFNMYFQHHKYRLINQFKTVFYILMNDLFQQHYL